MLTYKNGRFYCGDASFALPDNCMVDGFSEYATSHDGLTIYSKDGQYSMDISFDTFDGDAKADLENMAEEQECGFSPVPIVFGSLHGWELNQDHPDATGRTIAFDVNGGYDPGEEKLNILEIIVWSKEKLPWETIKNSKTFCDLLGSIQS